MSGPVAPLTDRGERTRREIVSAAIEVFGESGESRTSLSEIARRCGRSSQGIYRYFPNRRDLFEAAVNADEVRYTAVMDDALAGVRYPYLTGAHWRMAVEVIPRFPLIHRVYREGVMADLDLLINSEIAIRRRGALGEELRLGQAAGVVRPDVDVEIIAESTYRIGVQMQLPRLFSDPPRLDDATALGYVMTSALFAPRPDLSTARKREAFEAHLARALDAAASAR